MKRSTFWLAIGTGLTLGVLLLALAVLVGRRLRGEPAPLVASGVSAGGPTVAALLAAGVPADDAWQPCLLRRAEGAASLPALAAAGKRPDASADADPILFKGRRAKPYLFAPWVKEPHGDDDVVMVPITPLSPAHSGKSRRT